MMKRFLTLNDLLHEQGLSELDDGYLERQAYAVTGGIADTAIRNLPVLMG